MTSHRAAQGQSFLHVLERPAAPPEPRAALKDSPGPGARRKRRVSARAGLLRLAPRLTVLTGNRARPDWGAIAGGIGAAIVDSDLDDTPWCA